MKTHATLFAFAVFAATSATAAGDAGFIQRNGRKVYAVTGDGISADAVFYDLAGKGGHPIELTILDDAGHTVTDLSMLEGKNKSATHFSAAAATVEIVRQDDQRIEGKATFDDGKTTMSLPFAIDRNRVGRAKALASNLPPPPPAPPPPSNPRAMLMMAADLLELEINDWYGHHGNTWPTSIDQFHKQAPEQPGPIASRKLGPNGVLTIVFAADAPFVGGKTVVFTPTPTADGIEWRCTTQGVLDGCQ